MKIKQYSIDELLSGSPDLHSAISILIDRLMFLGETRTLAQWDAARIKSDEIRYSNTTEGEV